MEYTIQKLAELSGVSTRTLRYYDELGILKPARINSSGYRIYGQHEVNLMQQILFYRELGLQLTQIKDIVNDPAFDFSKALHEHREQLLDKRSQLDQLIANVEKTIAQSEGRMKMTDKEKFEGFKQKALKENEDKYGNEIREKYGEETVKQSNEKFMNMSQEDYEESVRIESEMREMLSNAMKSGDPAGELAQKAAELHKKWLMFHWPSYNKEAHAGLAQMYVDDERFTIYYDKEKPGTAEFLRDAVHIYTGMKDR
ncbi:MerR family transcriptional regulator [Bacillus sp. UMB0899]|uniref:MerR family transcriptional regulator n=1 Tax=Metabacillus schmidteae TaxID=2730405 RepID=UPI000C7FD9E4|nr:MerR family transcriptional regulator [Metabacillus schmidteae]PMC35920.1 MerR family transcriptional regulator [Bacillus sp. UMB0899]